MEALNEIHIRGFLLPQGRLFFSCAASFTLLLLPY